MVHKPLWTSWKRMNAELQHSLVRAQECPRPEVWPFCLGYHAESEEKPKEAVLYNLISPHYQRL